MYRDVTIKKPVHIYVSETRERECMQTQSMWVMRGRTSIRVNEKEGERDKQKRKEE
jgi:hypothetical protein